MATFVLAIVAAGLLLPFTSGAAIRAEGAHRTVGAKLASELMERVIRTDPDLIVGAYNYTEAEGAVTDSSGSLIADPAYARYSREVSCEDWEAGPAKYVLATVRVFYAGNEVAAMRRLVSK